MSAPGLPTVSVVVPTHNRAHLIGETLRSILTQTLQDFEVIVVDNGSTDGTDRVVAALADPRIRYHWQEDSGLPANSRNVGIRMARGRYIAFLDSDDLWLPRKLALQVEFMEAHPEVAFTCTNAVAFDGNGIHGRLNKVTLAGRRTARHLLLGNFITTLTVMVRRSCLEVVGLFNEDPALRTVEDFELWLRLAARFPVAYLPEVTARHRLHEGGLVNVNWVANLERAIPMLKGVVPSLPLSPREAALLVGSYYRRLARERGRVGDRAGATAAARAAWRVAPGLKNGALVCADRVAGRLLGSRVMPWVRSFKYSLDRVVWLARRRSQGRASWVVFKVGNGGSGGG